MCLGLLPAAYSETESFEATEISKGFKIQTQAAQGFRES